MDFNYTYRYSFQNHFYCFEFFPRQFIIDFTFLEVRHDGIVVVQVSIV